MKRFIYTIIGCLLAFSLFANPDKVVKDDLKPNHLKEAISKEMNMELVVGKAISIQGFQLQVTSLSTERDGHGLMAIPSLDVKLPVSFQNLVLAGNGQLKEGQIKALKEGEEMANGDFSLDMFLEASAQMSNATSALPFSLVKALQQKKNFYLPYGSGFFLTDFEMSQEGAFGSLALDAPTGIQGNFLNFYGDNIAIDPYDFCIEEDLPIIGTGGVIDDFEFPLRIVKGNPVEKEGSFLRLGCNGLEMFNLQAEYDFPSDQLVAASSPEDTVRATFVINSTDVQNFTTFINVTPFSIPGVNEMVFTIDSAYFDYSDEINLPGFAYTDPETGQAADESWKGFFMKSLSMTLPSSITAFNGGNTLEIGANNVVYDRGNGISATVFANNLLDLNSGNLGGWGISIDSFSMELINNSLGQTEMIGALFIPILGEGDDIPYEAIIGKDESGNTSVAFALEIQGDYTIPFLGDATMNLEESSLAGVRFGAGGFEPYADLTGTFNITIPAIGDLPEIAFPELGFQNFKLNDIDMAGAANQSADAVTGGLDKMSIGAFSFAGLNSEDIPDMPANPTAPPAGAEEEQSVGGFPVSIKNLNFISVPGTDLKKLSFNLGINLTGGDGGGISGESFLEIYGKVNYAKIISTSPWEAVSLDKVEVASIEVEGSFGPATFAGGFAFISDDPIYGTGVKGAISLELELASSYIEAQAIAQFGTTDHQNNNNDFRYFFMDVKTGFQPGIVLFPGIEMYGIGGGFFYNMDKSYVEIPDDLGAMLSDNIDLTPGTSFSGSIYTPKSGSLGFNASVIIGLQGSPQTFCADVGLGIQMDYETMGIKKVTLDGTMYAMSESFQKRKESSSVIAQVNMVMDLENGVLTGAYGFTMKAPSQAPIITGNGQGALQFDINPMDNVEHKEYLYFGKPRDEVSVKFGMAGIGTLNVEGYFMYGEDLPPPVPLEELHPLFAEAGFDPGSNLPGGKGLAIGLRYSFPRKTFKVGPFTAKIDAVFGFDASIKKYTSVTCANTGSGIGLDGWYVKGRAYAAIEASVSMYVDVWFYEGEVELISLGVAAQLQAELPNPSWIKGELFVKAKVLKTISVSTKLEFEYGEKCEMIRDPSKILADIKVISDVDPADNDEGVAVYNEIRAAFSYAMGTGLNSPPPYSDRLVASTDEDILEFFPMMTLEVREVSTNKLVQGSLEWSEDRRIASFSPNEILKPRTAYRAVVNVRWRMKLDDNPWKDPEQSDPEQKIINFVTGDRPEKIIDAMVDQDSQLPGNGQRNFFVGYGKPMLKMAQSGYDYLFAEEKTKTLGNKTIQVSYEYVMRITDVKTQDSKTFPLDGKPGDSGNARDVIYSKLEEPGLLQKNKIYFFEIVGVPKQDDADGVQSTTEAVSSSAGEEGVAIETVSTKLQKQEPNPALVYDIIYQFHFKTSKYNNFRQKLETIDFVKQVNSSKQEVTGYSGLNLDLQQIGGDVIRIADHYLLFKVEEGFDKWDQKRLANNIHFSEDQNDPTMKNNKHPLSTKMFEEKPVYTQGIRRQYYPTWNDCVEFNNLPFLTQSCSGNLFQNWQFAPVNTNSPNNLLTANAYAKYHRSANNMGWDKAYQKYYGGNMVSETDVLLAFDQALEKNVNESSWKEYYWGISFPKSGEEELTRDEISSGEPSTVTPPTGRSDDRKMNAGTTQWDFAFVSKRNRGIYNQRSIYAAMYEMIQEREVFVTEQRQGFYELETISNDYLQFFRDISDGARLMDASLSKYYYPFNVELISYNLRNKRKPVFIQLRTPSNGKWNSLLEQAPATNPVIIRAMENFSM